jgi:hypothetical protein
VQHDFDWHEVGRVVDWKQVVPRFARIEHRPPFADVPRLPDVDDRGDKVLHRPEFGQDVMTLAV